MDLKQLFEEIESNKTRYIADLSNACAIKSISALPEYKHELQNMVEWVLAFLVKLGANCELVNVGERTLSNGEIVSLPNVIVAQLGNDSKKKTICVYGHLDVQPASKEDGWITEPFVLTEKDGKLYGRGTSDDKGPVLCWIHAIEAYQKLGMELPVNVKFLFEAMEESGSIGLEKLVNDRKSFLENIDFICISDNYWLGKTKPCLTYGLRGICSFYIEIKCASKDLHSGVFGGTIHEAMSDLIYLLNTLVDKNGKILVRDIERDVLPIHTSEKDLYESIDFNVNHYKNELGASKLRHNDDKIEILMHRWRYPSLSIHGIEGAFYGPGQKTIIPHKVTGKFTIRLVPNQEPQHIIECVKDYIQQKWLERGSPNEMKINSDGGSKAWIENPNHPHYEAAKNAVKHVYDVYPDMTREGGSIPVTLTLQKATGKNILLLPIGSSDDGAHSQNEKINISNYIQGTKLFTAYLYEVSKIN